MNTVISKLIILLLVFTSCSKGEFSEYAEVKILGHAGMGIEHIYPLNSYASISLALHLGAQGTEIDIQMTNDSVFVAYHDDDLSEETAHSGQVFEKEWKEIQDAKYLFPMYADYRLLSLNQLLNNLPKLRQQTIYLDSKSLNPRRDSQYLHTYTNALIRLIDQHQLSETIYIEMSRADLLQMLHNKRPEIPVIFNGHFQECMNMAQKHPIEGISLSVDETSKAEVQEAQAKGLQVVLFNTHSRQRNKDAVKMEPDMILADKLKHLLNILGR